MEGSLSANLQLWRAAGDGSGELPAYDAERAAWLAAQECLRHTPRRSDALEPFSLAWYLQIEQRRYSRHGAWLPKLLEFDKHPGEQLLAIGSGLGTDWARYAHHGSDVTVCLADADQLSLVRRNFELRGLTARFRQIGSMRWPIENASMDVVHLNFTQSSTDEVTACVDEVYRVLRPGGKLIALLPAHYDVNYWQKLLLPWTRIGHSSGANQTLWTRRQVRQCFDRFSELRIYQRHLRRSELPHVWRWMLLPILERMMGRFLVLKTFKSISTAMAVNCAA